MELGFSSVLSSVLIAGLIILAARVLDWLWFRPKKLEKLLRKQGLQGNPYRFLIGDLKDFFTVTKEEQPKSIQLSDDIPAHSLPYYHQLCTKYGTITGENCFMWFGPSPRLIIYDPLLLKEIFAKTDMFHKPVPDPFAQRVAGGLLLLEDEKWAKHRKIVNPAFHLEKLKNMVPAIRLSCSNMIDKWEALFGNGEESQEIDVWPHLDNLSGDVISRTAFGSSHEQGGRIFELQKEQVKLCLELIKFFFIPGWRFVPTKANRRMAAISKEIQSILRGIISQREKAMASGDRIDEDLLSTLMASNLEEIQEDGNKKNMGLSIEDVIEECKLFYFAGSETTSSLLVWTMVMLSNHQEWQARAREEVLQVFGTKEPTFDALNRLKTVTMILHEVLRLYSPAPMTGRAPTKTVKLGNITLPVGVDLMILIGLLHHDPKIWGDDAKEFNPERFSKGISNATITQFSFTPFSSGPRACIGQHFVMIKAKVILAMMLQRFRFELSSSYMHAPFSVLTLQPQHGASLILHKL